MILSGKPDVSFWLSGQDILSLQFQMERNNDELISDMLRSIDRNADSIRRMEKQLMKHNRVLDRHSKELNRHSEELTRQVNRNEEFFKEFREWMKGSEQVQNNHLEMIVHNARLLDRIVKTNRLKI